MEASPDLGLYLVAAPIQTPPYQQTAWKGRRDGDSLQRYDLVPNLQLQVGDENK